MANEDTPIPVPPVNENGILQAPSNDDLFKLQDAAIEKLRERNTPKEPTKKLEEKPVPPKKEKKAKDLFNGAKQVTEEIKTKKTPEKEEPLAEDSPEDTKDTPIVPGFMKDLPVMDPSKLFGEKTDEEVPAEDDVEEDEEQPEKEPEANLDRETNLKNLRGLVKNFKSERDQLSAKVKELEMKLAAVPDVNGVQAELSRSRERIAALEPYEKMFALHQNPEFKAKYVDGIQTHVDEMKKIARDYGLDEGIVQDILATENRKELDDLLTESFTNISAQGDIKLLKNKIEGLYKERQELEKKPQETLQMMEAKRIEREAEDNNRRNAVFNQVLTEGWSSAVVAARELPEAQRIPELMEVPGKKDHNEKVVRPTLNAAHNLGKNGLAHIENMIRNKAVIDPGFATWFMTLCTQAVATQTVNYTRMALYEQLQKENAAKAKSRTAKRPSLNGGGRGAPAAENRKLTGKERAAEIFFSVQRDTAE